MRQIKFRGKRIDDGKWVYGYLFRSTKSTVKAITLGYYIQVIGEDLTHISYEVIPETVGQFTGLKDKNGVEIYEGDIIKYYQPHSKKIETHIVQWDKVFACFGLFEKEGGWCKESDWLKIEDIDIAGHNEAKKDIIAIEHTMIPINEINYMFINSNRQREIIEKLMPGTFDDNRSDRANCLIFLKNIKEKGRYQELLNELWQ